MSLARARSTTGRPPVRRAPGTTSRGSRRRRWAAARWPRGALRGGRRAPPGEWGGGASGDLSASATSAGILARPGEPADLILSTGSIYVVSIDEEIRLPAAPWPESESAIRFLGGHPHAALIQARPRLPGPRARPRPLLRLGPGGFRRDVHHRGDPRGHPAAPLLRGRPREPGLHLDPVLGQQRLGGIDHRPRDDLVGPVGAGPGLRHLPDRLRRADDQPPGHPAPRRGAGHRPQRRSEQPGALLGAPRRLLRHLRCFPRRAALVRQPGPLRRRAAARPDLPHRPGLADHRHLRRAALRRQHRPRLRHHRRHQPVQPGVPRRSGVLRAGRHGYRVERQPALG